MTSPSRLATRLRLVRPATSSTLGRSFTSTTATAQHEAWPQRTPRGDYYEVLLHNRPAYAFNEKSGQPSSPSNPDALPSSQLPTQPAPPTLNDKPGEKQVKSFDTTPQLISGQEKARKVFGSRLLGLEEEANRLATKKAQSTYLAGVLIPPKPQEPDNCCMSGCVNCVWDLFRDEMEEWSAKNAEAKQRTKAGSRTMDSDGGGSETNRVPELADKKIANDMWDEEVFKNVPVGIREFMKQEKKLKERHAKEGTKGS